MGSKSHQKPEPRIREKSTRVRWQSCFPTSVTHRRRLTLNKNTLHERRGCFWIVCLFCCSKNLRPDKQKTTDQVPATVFQKVITQVLHSHFSAFITQNLMLPKVCTCLHAGNDGSGSDGPPVSSPNGQPLASPGCKYARLSWKCLRYKKNLKRRLPGTSPFITWFKRDWCI